MIPSMARAEVRIKDFGVGATGIVAISPNSVIALDQQTH